MLEVQGTYKQREESKSSVFSHFSFQGFLVLVQAKQANKVEK
jgi:hypothetical protein